jgi:tRNA threonylcarbamoyladenosine biosynthesis protein TsaE
MPDAEFSLHAMSEWGQALGARLSPGAVVTFAGDLGAGKTTLVQAVCRGYGVKEVVTSPTFALVHEYRSARSPVLHVDLFRLDGPQDLAGIGWDDALSAGALVLIEWPERAGRELPRDVTAVHLSHIKGRPDSRRVTW